MSRAGRSLLLLLPVASAFVLQSSPRLRSPLLAKINQDDLAGDDDDKWSLSKFQAANKEKGPQLEADEDDEDDDDEDAKWSLSKLKKAQSKNKPKAAKLSLPRLGVGCAAWGDAGRGFDAADLQGAYDALCDAGLAFFATSQAYGAGSAEQLLGQFAAARSDDAKPLVATTYAPGWLSGGRSKVVAALEQGSLERLGLADVDLYQVSHRFLYPGGTQALLAGAARAKDRGLCAAVGVVGFSGAQVEAAHKYLASLGVTLASNTVELSLLHQDALDDGTVDACKRLGVTVLAGAPLNHGLCSGRYTASNPTGGKFVKNPRQAQRFKADDLRKVYPLAAALESVARSVSSRGDTVTDAATGVEKKVKATPAQVALNWVVAKGAVPLPGVNSAADAREVAGCAGWKLKAGDVAQLDKAAAASQQKVKREFVPLFNE